ncbi:MAG: Smr/MutS family protein [Planctomycetota bacterium]
MDLHRLSGSDAARVLRRELHAARVRGEAGLVAITGLGFGNALQEPVLRSHVERWLASQEARQLGVLGFERVHRGGALEIRLVAPKDRARVDREWEE